MIPRACPLASKGASLLGLLLLLAGASCLMAQSEPVDPSTPYGKIIREIRIHGLRHTGESEVRSQLASREGEVYTEEKARQDIRWLKRLEIFTSIEVRTIPVEDEIALIIEVQEFPVFVPFPTLNITEENGASGGLGGRVSSLMHRAVALTGSFKVGGLTEADMSIRAPWRLRRREWYGAKYNYRDRINKQFSFRENSHELDLRIGVSPHPDWMLSGKFGYLSMGSDIPGITLSSTNRDHTPALGALLEYDGRDSQAVPHRGWQGIFDITQNGGVLGGDGNFVTTQIDIRRYQPLSKRQVLVFFSYASFQSGLVGKDVPVYREYRIGGTNTVRGWNDNARTGKNQFLNTIEYRYELVPPKTFRVYKFGFYLGLQLAGFADLGTAWTPGSDFTRNMIAGGGFGLRILMPFLDTIRMDFGFGQSGTGIHPSIHIREKAQYSRNRIR